MKTSSSVEAEQGSFFDNTIQLKQISHGYQELVNFPSTEEVFRAVFENSFHANCFGNGHGQTLEANETICKIFGYTKDEFLHVTTKQIFDTTDSNYADYLSQRLDNGKAKGEITGIRKNREHFLCEISTIIFTDDNGKTRTLNTIQDISKKYIVDEIMYK